MGLPRLMTVIYRISHAPEPALHARSVHGCPMVIADSMEPVQSMASGEWYTSKRAIRAEYKRLGMTEVGNDSSIINPKPFKKPKPDRKEIKAAVNKAFSRAGFGA